MQGRILFADTVARVCIRELPCIDVLLSAGSTNDGEGGKFVWVHRKITEEKV